MNRFAKALARFDLWLLVCVFMPISHWIDWRFHKNQFEQAAVVLSLGLAMNVGANFEGFLRLHWLGAVGLFGSGVLIFVYSHWLKLLNIASQKYEKRPDQISHEQAFFMVMILPPLRLMLVTTGLVLCVPTPHQTLIRMMVDPWMVMLGIALYLAGGLPPKRPRREKKVWAWSLHRLATTPT